jgi:CHAT domain-containing protein/tetratricopeptide (TPR) repeat protein
LLVIAALTAVVPGAQAQDDPSEVERLRAELRSLAPLDQVTILNDLSSRFYQSGQFEKGIYYANWALVLAKSSFIEGDKNYIEAIHNLASLITEVGQYAQAGSLREKAYALALTHLTEGDPLRLAVMNGLAVHYSLMRRFNDAEAIFTRLLNECESHLGSDDEYTLGAIVNLGGLLQDTGRYTAAISLLEPVIDYYRHHGQSEESNALTAAVLLSSSYLKAGRSNDAIKLLQDALEASRSRNGPTHPATLVILNSLAYTVDRSGDVDRALPIYRQVAEAAATRFGKDHPNTLTTELSVISVLIRQNNMKEVVEGLTRIGPLSLRWTTAQLYETVQAAEREHLLARQSTYPDVALSFALRDGTPASQKLGANVVLQWKQLHGEQDALLRRFLAARSDAETVELAKKLVALRNRLAIAFHLGSPAATTLLNEVEATEAKLAELSRDFAEIRRSQRTGLDEVAASLDKDEALLEFRIFRPINIEGGPQGGPHLIGVLIGSNFDPVLHDLGPHTDIEQEVEQATSPENPSDLRQAAFRALSDRLLQPFTDRIAKLRRIFVAPDGALNLLPIEMLPFGKSAYWIEAQDLRFVSTGRVLARKREPGRSDLFVGFGAVQFDAPAVPGQAANAEETVISRTTGAARLLSQMKPLGSLPESGPEIENVARKWKAGTGGRAITYLGAKASEGAVKSLSEPPDVLHFATHGFYLANPEASGEPMLLSGLAMAQANLAIERLVDVQGEDGILWALEAMNLNLSGTRLVVMSACDTAQGVMDAYEGVYGLARGFQIAGSKNVIVTLWALNDSRARAFMEEFYQRWTSTGALGDPADALRATKLAWLNSENPDRSDFSVWAPYMLLQQGK